MENLTFPVEVPHIKGLEKFATLKELSAALSMVESVFGFNRADLERLIRLKKVNDYSFSLDATSEDDESPELFRGREDITIEIYPLDHLVMITHLAAHNQGLHKLIDALCLLPKNIGRKEDLQMLFAQYFPEFYSEVYDDKPTEVSPRNKSDIRALRKSTVEDLITVVKCK